MSWAALQLQLTERASELAAIEHLSPSEQRSHAGSIRHMLARCWRRGVWAMHQSLTISRS